MKQLLVSTISVGHTKNEFWLSLVFCLGRHVLPLGVGVGVGIGLAVALERVNHRTTKSI